MFQKLQRKWKVDGWSLALILITFALGGSACGFIGKKIMNLFGLDKGFIWFVIYIIILTIIWPLCVLVISIPMGQFRFFKKYIAKIFSRFGGKQQIAARPVNMAIFASGTGSNAKKIIGHFSKNPNVNIAMLVSNKSEAPVLQIARDAGIPTLIIEKSLFDSGDIYKQQLLDKKIDWIILAGFLWKVPAAFIRQWPGRIINIHPALLPKHGGKGMYGQRVHDAVIAAGDKQTGISIHLVDEVYDNGKVIFYATCPVDPADTSETLAQKVHALEHAHFANVIEKEIEKQKTS